MVDNYVACGGFEMKDVHVISVAEFNARSGKNWDAPMSEYIGEIPGYHIGLNKEVITKDGKIDAISCDWPVYLDELDSDYEDEKQAWDHDMFGLTYTGNVVFRGYYESFWWDEERDEYFREVDLSDIINKYIVRNDDTEQYA